MWRHAQIRALQQGTLSLALPEAVSVRDLDDEVILALERGQLILLRRADVLEDSLRGLGSGLQIRSGRTE